MEYIFVRYQLCNDLARKLGKLELVLVVVHWNIDKVR